MGWHKTGHRNNGLQASRVEKLAEICHKLGIGGIMAIGYVNRWGEQPSASENGGNDAFLRDTGPTETRETRGGDGFVSAQESAQSVRGVFL